MFLFSNKKNTCCGCKVCAAICPAHCITFCEDEESFVYPKRNSDKCINCHLCESVCPMVAPGSQSSPLTQKVGVHSKKKVIEYSSSGGAFSALCEILVPQGFKVYGALLDERLTCRISDSDTENGYEHFRKSKYIQAETDDCFAKVERDLVAGHKVFFTGVPCHCTALNLYLKAKKNVSVSNLVVSDILCHGVPSQSLFNSYISELEKDNGSKVKAFVFRNKHILNGTVNSRSVQVDFYDGSTRYLGIGQCSYLRGYHTRLFYRPSCYNCPFANVHRNSDITLADAWGIEEKYSNLNSLNGVSLIMANTENGRSLLNKMGLNGMVLYDIDLSWAVSSNDTLRESTKMHPQRSRFFANYKKGFTKSVERYAIPPLPIRVLKRIKRTIRKLF